MSTTDLPPLSPRMYEVLRHIVESEAPYRVYSAISSGTEDEDRAFDVEVKVLRAYFEQRSNRNAPNHGGIRISSMSTPRDTQFKGFAEALHNAIRLKFDDLHNQNFWGELDKAKKTEADITMVIAQRAYDLVNHACFEISDLRGVDLCDDQMLEAVTDLPALPSEPKEQS